MLTIFTGSAGPGFAALADSILARLPDLETQPAPVQVGGSDRLAEHLIIAPEPSSEPEITQTPTPPATPSPEPGPAITATATITQTQPPIILTAPPVTNVLTTTLPVTLTLSAKTPFLPPGGPLSLDWDIQNFDQFPPDENLKLAISAPAGFVPRGNYPGVYDPVTNTITFTPDKDKGKLKWVAGDTSYGPYYFTAVLSYAGEVLSADDLTLDEQYVFAIGMSGGQAVGVMRGITVTVDIPNGALPEPVYLRILPPSELTGPDRTLSSNTFQLTALGQNSGQLITQFDEDLIVRIAYSEVQYGGDETSLTMFYFDETDGIWRGLPSWVDTESNLLSASTDHFTNLDWSNLDWEVARTPTLDGFNVSSFTGAAEYAFPIWVPPGPGGLQPDLVLTYNSQVVDSANAYTQASWVGMGWSLETPYIVRNMNGSINSSTDDNYSIVLNGAGGYMLPVVDNNSSYEEYRTVNESFVRIRYYTGTDTWQAWDKAGNQYFFNHKVRYPDFDSQGCWQTDRTWRWSLTKIRNVHGQELVFTYSLEEKDLERYCETTEETEIFEDVDIAVYVHEITYSNGKYKVVFDRGVSLNQIGDREDYDGNWDDIEWPVFFQRARLYAIRIEHYNGTAWETVRTY